MKAKEEKLDGVFENYGGKKRFDVSHPDFRNPLRVAAPNEEAAIVAAAKVRGVPWQKYEFYAYCEVFRV